MAGVVYVCVSSTGQEGVSEAGLKAYQDMTYYLTTFIEHVSMCTATVDTEQNTSCSVCLV